VRQHRYHFSTRDLLMMAALAALGGVASTYLNAVGHFFQSMLGFAGTTQWAAGLHVLWLTLAVGLTRKAGAGTVTGILKGVVELLAGSTHGLLVVLVSIVAGILVDLGFLPFRDKERLAAYAFAGGLASASNVFVFQLFASLPADVLAYGAMLLIGTVAFLSGILFAGLLARMLLNALREAGVVRDRPPAPVKGPVYPFFLAAAVLLTAGLAIYLRGALAGPATLHIGGSVAAPYSFPTEHGDVEEVTADVVQHGVTTRYTGLPVADLLARARPAPEAQLLLITAADGYAFFLSMNEVQESDSLLLARQGSGQDASYNIVGAANTKAWVRGVSQLTAVGGATLEIEGALAAPTPYDPDTWQFEMDSTDVALPGGTRKLQGAPLGAVLASMDPTPDARSVLLHTDGAPVSLPLAELVDDDGIRLFTVIGEEDVTFAVARMNGQVLAAPVTRIVVEE